ncbi:MAG: LysM peptidoglycan-binding domain-containing protein, partial [Chloroflexi bacterium]|nr:LysM peptidoglycan-binding domain-containing protein [Chloroflexota bacterium]
QFEDTAVRALAKWISILSLIVVALWGLLPQVWRRRRIAVGIAMLLVLTLSACDVGSGAPTVETTARATRASRSDVSVTPEVAIIVPTNTATPTPRPASVQYTVQQGDTIGAIAQKYGTTVDAILRANNLPRPEALRAGQVITIPLPTPVPTATGSVGPNATPIPPPAATPTIYVVQQGDVLSAIAARYNIPVDQIMAANGMTDTLLKVGQQLIIPARTPTPTPTTTAFPTFTPTPKLAYGAPTLLFPPDGMTLVSDAAPVLNWTSVGALDDRDYYVLRMRTLDGRRTESIWLKTPSYRVLDDWRSMTVQWEVIVLELTQTNADGTREGKIQSPFSDTRQFTWQ